MPIIAGLAGSAPAASKPLRVAAICDAPIDERCDVLLLGSAGQYINTVGEILCLAGMSGGLHVSQKNDHPITVLRGHSIAEVVLDREPIDYTGIGTPDVVLCVAAEGVARRKKVFGTLTEACAGRQRQQAFYTGYPGKGYKCRLCRPADTLIGAGPGGSGGSGAGRDPAHPRNACRRFKSPL